MDTNQQQPEDLATLEKRHGGNAASVIADAQKALDRVTLKNPRIFEAMLNGGATNNPAVIETLARVQREYYAKRGG